VTIRVSDRAEGERFYTTVLGSLGIEPSHSSDMGPEWDDFTLAEAGEGLGPTRNVHLAFCADSRASVDRFWQVGREAGYADDGAPGERPQYRPDYYGAFLRDPDGNSVEAVHHGDIRRGGHIDHLWIGVRDLDAAAGFYSTIAPHTGLREGRRWDEGRQFRGAWATFSLVADGRPATENLHIAFPALDRLTVDDFHRAATSAGYRDNGAPGERPTYHPGYYGAYVLDPDGTNVESVFHDRP
jgi:catechol 2,3-dioxygenase-like lactoylglutathione lyase family enzyme